MPVRSFRCNLYTRGRRDPSSCASLCYAGSGESMALPEQFKKAYQILSWVSLAGLIVVIVLVLRKSPAPDVPNDPNAAARAEQKLQAADLARAAGRPAQVALDRTELNSYLAENLQVEGARVPVEVDAVGGGSRVLRALRRAVPPRPTRNLRSRTCNRR